MRDWGAEQIEVCIKAEFQKGFCLARMSQIRAQANQGGHRLKGSPPYSPCHFVFAYWDPKKLFLLRTAG